MWQQLYEAHRDSGVEVLTVAMDAQGAARALPYVERAGATFTTVVDGDNVLGQLLNARAIPNGVLLDEEGVICHIDLGGFDIHRAETRRLVVNWFNQGANGVDTPSRSDDLPLDKQALEAFDRGLALLRAGETSAATAEWRRAIETDPTNWIIRKQLWAVENPERFYAGDVDYGWQREQIERGR